jgi:DNA polymerase
VSAVAGALAELHARGLMFTTEGRALVLEADREPTAREDSWIAKNTAALVRELTAVRLDFETGSPLELRKASAEVYAADPRTEVLCLAWCVGRGDVQVWQPGESPPAELLDALIGGAGPVVSHGSFDRLIWQEKMVSAGWPQIPLERWSDTSARARAYRIPAGLEKAAERLELRQRKDNAGKDLIRRATTAARDGKPLTDAQWVSFLDYCKADVEVARELDQRLPHLTGADRQMFELNERMNDRGLPIDLDLVRALGAVHDSENERLNARIAPVTDGEITSLNQTARLLGWLNAHQSGLANLRRETLEAWTENDLFGGPVAEGVQLRQEFAHSAGAKLKKLVASTSADGRVRGCFAWHGAHTGRWAGRGCQPQNFPRPGAVADVDATLTALLQSGGPVDSDNGLSVKARISACLRATIAAPAGYELVVGDLKQIESRVLCWLAGQEDMLGAYRRRDDPYAATARNLGSTDRQFGKLLTLAAGFGGSAKMLLQKAPVFGLTLTQMEAEAAISAWRAANPAITRFWAALHGAMITVVEAPLGRERRGHHLAVFRGGDDTLRIKLPSQRDLIFHEPRMEPNPDHDDRPELSYWQVLGADWKRIWSWHGRACENVVQGVAYDLLADAMLRMDATGLDIIGTVHDEVIALAPADQAESMLQTMLAILSDPPSWASDLPLAAEGFHSRRYVKPKT